jgi:hypothetical protein
MDTVPKVYAAIASVQADLAVGGISKSRKNQQQGYQFRGIDDVYNALAGVLAKHRLCILPRVLARTLTERETKSGGTLFSVTVEAEFDFVSAEDGSKHTIKTFGEAMDSGDKATNKAMSAAYKYAAMQAFCIPTEGDNDADSHTPTEVKPRQEPKQSPASPITPALVEAIKRAGDANGTDFDALRKYYKIPYVKDLPAALYDDCMKRVKAGEFKKQAVHANGDEHYQGPGTQP